MRIKPSRTVTRIALSHARPTLSQSQGMRMRVHLVHAVLLCTSQLYFESAVRCAVALRAKPQS